MHLLDLPDELLLVILRKLNNIDVFCSLLDINNTRLALLAQDKIFTGIINFVDIANISLIDRFCMDILPRIHHNIRYMILKPVFMERVLLATAYPNLTELKLFNFNQQIALKYFTDESSLRSIFQQRITNLILVNNDRMEKISQVQDYTKNIYANILNFFKNLKHLNIAGDNVPGLLLRNLPSTTFNSSILTHLSVNVRSFDDCVCLLDGRLRQLTTLNLTVPVLTASPAIAHDLDKLPNLKYFSFKSVFSYLRYDHMLSLLRRMSCLESLTLDMSMRGGNRVIDGTCLQNDILVHMPHLHSFTFYIASVIDTCNLSYNFCENLQQTLLNIRQQKAACMVNYGTLDIATCSIFSVPFGFNSLVYVGNIFPNIVFSCVTFLMISDGAPFEHEFFVRIARSFPLLKCLHIYNGRAQLLVDDLTLSSDHSQSYSVVEYPHLSSLHVSFVNHQDYLEQFLNETKAFVPCLTELTVCYFALETVTNNFTREATRRNCAKVKRLNAPGPLVNSEDYSHYFPSL